MKYFKTFLFLLIFPMVALTTEVESSKTQAFAKFEYGLVSVLQHKSQWGEQSSEFNYVKDGGQDLLFPTWRAEAGVQTSSHHRFSFLYQPIFVETEVVLAHELKLDDITFAKNTNLLVTYDFPFYRFNYWYLNSESDSMKFWFGAGLQIRNANIKFRDRNGTQAFQSSSLGPVPVLNFLFENRLTDKLTLNNAVAGFWAPIKYLNGGKTDVNGWIYEVESQARLQVQDDLTCFAGFRLLGGGAVGSSKTKRQSGGTYNKDVLVTGSLTAGIIKQM